MEILKQKINVYCERYWFLLPITFIIGSGVTYGKFRLFHLFSLFFLLPIILKLKDKKIERWEISFCLFVLWEIVSSAWASNRFNSFRYLFCLLNGVFLIYSVKSFVNTGPNELQKILKKIYCFNYFMLVFGFFETLQLVRWPSNLYSFSYYSKNIPELLSHYSTNIEGLWFVKTLPSVFFWNTNDFSFYLVSTLPFIFLVEIKQKWTRVLYLLLLLWVLIASASRASLFSVVLALFALSSPYFNVSRKNRIFSAVLIGIIISFVLFAQELSFLGINRQSKLIAFSSSALTYMEHKTLEHKTTAVTYKKFYSDTSSIKRSRILIEALTIFKKNILCGIGAGNLEIKVDGPPINVHNFWIEILVETGLIGALLFNLWIFSWLYKIRIFRKERKYFYLSFFIMIPCALSVSSAIYQPGFWIPILLVKILI